MGQKIHPIGFRLAVTRDWDSSWYANSRDFAPTLLQDIKIREFLKKKLAGASVSRVTIKRTAKSAKITIHSARPGVVIGNKGADIEKLRAEIRHLAGTEAVEVGIEEVRKPEIDATLIAASIAKQLESRIMFRRAMKRAMQNAMRGVQGIKVMSAGRLNGAEIARSEWYREGRVPLHTLRANIDYGQAEARTTYGVIGIKVWVFKGETMAHNAEPTTSAKDDANQPSAPKRTRRAGVKNAATS
jgi:small subunit ribosomal protein S3